MVFLRRYSAFLVLTTAASDLEVVTPSVVALEAVLDAGGSEVSDDRGIGGRAPFNPSADNMFVIGHEALQLGSSTSKLFKQ